jgi:hypothetical protein
MSQASRLKPKRARRRGAGLRSSRVGANTAEVRRWVVPYEGTAARSTYYCMSGRSTRQAAGGQQGIGMAELAPLGGWQGPGLEVGQLVQQVQPRENA